MLYSTINGSMVQSMVQYNQWFNGTVNGTVQSMVRQLIHIFAILCKKRYDFITCRYYYKSCELLFILNFLHAH